MTAPSRDRTVHAPHKRRRRALAEYRNRRGEPVQIAEVTATDAKNAFGTVLETAIEEGVVAITRHDSPKAVLLSVDEFNALVEARGSKLDTLAREFDALLEKMQSPGARRGAKAAFGASRRRMGKAAVAATRKRG